MEGGGRARGRGTSAPPPRHPAPGPPQRTGPSNIRLVDVDEGEREAGQEETGHTAVAAQTETVARQRGPGQYGPRLAALRNSTVERSTVQSATTCTRLQARPKFRARTVRYTAI